MLCKVSTQCHCMRITVFYAQVNIRHSTIERTGTCITRFLTFFNHTSCKPEHIFCFSLIAWYFFLKSRRVFSQNKFRTVLSITNQTNGCRNINSLTDFILAFRYKKNTEILFFLHLINGCLQSVRHVHFSIRLYRIVLGSEIECFRIIRFHWVDGVQFHCIKLHTEHSQQKH